MSVMEDKIEARGLELAVEHQRYPELELIRQVDTDEWYVKTYFVTYDYDDGFECECPYNQHKGECKHIKALKFCKMNNIYIPLSPSAKEY